MSQYEDLKRTLIDLVSDYWNDKEQLNTMFNETDLTPDSIAMRQRARLLTESAFDKEDAIKILEDNL